MTRPLYDLHTHTTASDGRLSPAELVRKAVREKLTALAVTDHDTVDAIDAAREEAAHSDPSLEIIAGIEVSANYEDASVHVLGLFVRHREPWLVEFFAQARERRIERIHRILAKLDAVGVHVEAQDVFAKSTHGTVGRPHVAEVLVDRGVVSTFSEAFDRYLGHGAPAYVGYEKVTLRDATDLITRAGGVASLAHPGLLERDELIPKMAEQGLQAIEAYHTDHSPELAARYVQTAERLGLLVTGGSDFHTEDGNGPTRLGCPELTAEAFEKIRQAAKV
jgi:predicted metal-dependent phosphoesterase TrpH